MPANAAIISVVIIGCKIASTRASITPMLKILLIIFFPLCSSNFSPLLDLISRTSANFSLTSPLNSAVAACSLRPSRAIIRPTGKRIKMTIGTIVKIKTAICQSITKRIIKEKSSWMAPVIKLGNCEAIRSLITPVSLTRRELVSPALFSSK